jgi:plastocyanin
MWGQPPNIAVTGVVSVERPGRAQTSDASNAVVWMKAASPAVTPLPSAGTFAIRQQRKQFDPRVLAVPAGSTVNFPNLDPFFHNVFSLFNGKSFDLGLYEAGASHSARFDRVGVSYIFCNIHPEMSAVVVVVDAPYYSVTSRHGEFTIPNVPAGRYLLSVWHERGKPETAADLPREVTIGPQSSALARIRLMDAGQVLAPHKNKYGVDYDSPAPAYKK